MRRRAAADAEELQQVNVRIDARKVRIAQRLALRQGKSMTAFIDDLITAEIQREQEAILKDFEQQKARAQEEEEALRSDLHAVISGES